MTTIYKSDDVTVMRDDSKWEVYKVKPTHGRARTFSGESAWSDAERYAYDIDRNAIGCISLFER